QAGEKRPGIAPRELEERSPGLGASLGFGGGGGRHGKRGGELIELEVPQGGDVGLQRAVGRASIGELLHRDRLELGLRGLERLERLIGFNEVQILVLALERGEERNRVWALGFF